MTQKNKKIYLDYAGTTPLSSDTKNYLISIFDIFGNPSSLHSAGQAASQLLFEARKSVAGFINSPPENIYFTSGGSASNTLGIKGYSTKNNCCILYSPIAHKSVLKCVKSCTCSYPLSVNKNGELLLSDLEKRLNTAPLKPFIIIDYANSEIGTVQNVREIIRLVHRHSGVIYLDCTGSIPTIPVNVEELDIDMLGFSAHKLGGLKGCGVFYKKPDIELEPLIYGNQEQGLVGGTENILGIASLYSAVRHYDYASVSSQNRDYVYQYVTDNIPGSYLIGSLKNRLAHNLYICFPGIDGEALMILLDMENIQVSTGSACNSHSLSASTTLSAIGMKPEDIHSCIRMTFSGKEKKTELDYICFKLKECVKRLR